MYMTNVPRQAGNNKVVAIIQARMGSTRLPGKSLSDIAGQPLLGHVIDRVRACRTVHEVMVATTAGPEDEAIVTFCAQKHVRTYRGSENDVLDRYYHAAREAGAAIVVRITADDPFKDPDIVDNVCRYVTEQSDVDYASNTLEPTYPEGLDVEVVRFGALTRAWREARLTSEREHVTPYIWKNPDRFRVVNVKYAEDLSSLRWTIDYDEDIQFARAVYARLYHGNVFRMLEILQLLKDEPSLARINTGFVRNAGYARSIELDKKNPVT